MTAIPQTASVSGDRNIVIQAIGSGVDVRIGAEAHLRLTQYENRTRLATKGKSPGALLSAYRRDIAPLLGRDAILGDLRRWLGGAAPVSVRVLVGAGGRGKTRLALELARLVSKEGWLAGFVEPSELERFTTGQNAAGWGWDRPTLIVVDYAAGRAERLQSFLRELVDAPDGRPPLRLLLLERQAHRAIGWLSTVVGRGHDDASRAAIELLDPPEPVELPAIDDRAARHAIFAAMLRHAPGELTAPAPGADADFDRLLADRKWAGDPLYLMMAALVADASGVAAALSLSRTDLALDIGGRELDWIGNVAASQGVDAAPPGDRRGALARHMAVLATLAQGLPVPAARSLAESEGKRLGSTAPANAVLDTLRDALPATERADSFAPILPDIVGEAALLAWLGETGPIERWGLAPLEILRAAALLSMTRTSEVLVRTAQDFAAAGRAEPVRWLEGLVTEFDADLGALMEIGNALPDQTLVLRELAVRLFALILAKLRALATTTEASAGTEAARDWIENLIATSLNNLGLHLADLGRREDALDAAREAVDIRRRLAAERPDDFLPDLAASLGNLGVRLADLGRREDALDAAREASDIYRRLAAERPDAFLPDLAMSLNNLGAMLSNLGRREDALDATREASDIYRRLAAERPDAFPPGLARSMNNLSTSLGDLGRREDALDAARKASDIYRRLAAERPDAFLPDLAMSLNNLGNRLADLGRREDALDAAREASDIYRRLAAERPDAFLPDLAMSLNNLGVMLCNLGRREDALDAAREAADIYRRLTAERPDAFLPDLAGSLNNLGLRLADLGRREDALDAAREAGDIYRRLAAERPDAFLPDLAMSLNNLGNRLADLGRREDALDAAREAVDIRRRLAAERPDAFLPDLAMLLNNLGNRLADLGRCEEALDAARKAVDIRRRLAAERPDAFLPNLASSMNNLGNRLTDLGRREEALDAARVATDIYRRLAAERPDAFLPDLAASLNNLGNHLANLGRREEALDTAREAADIYRRLADERPDAFLPDLALSLNNLGVRLADLGRHEEALEAVREAVSALKPSFLKTPAAFAQRMALMCRHYLHRCEQLGREPDAELLRPIVEWFQSQSNE